MKVVLEDGMTLDCGNYKAVDAGLVLTEDKKRKQVIGFVPHDEVRFVLPDDVLTQRETENGSPEFVYVSDAAQQARIEELEATVADLEAQLVDAATDAEAGAKARHHVDEPENLEVIDGIGPTYHERLTDAGITTFEQLRRSSVSKVVEATGVSEERAQEWVDATKMRGGELVPTEEEETGDGTATDETDETDETDDEPTEDESETTPEESSATS